MVTNQQEWQNKEEHTIANCVIYTITNKYNGKVYVGSSEKLTARWGKHRNELKLGRHRNPHMQYAYNKYGSDCFEYEILEYTEKEMLLHVELYWMNMLDTFNSDNGYNLNNPLKCGTRTYKPIDVYDMAGNFIKRFKAIRYASEELNISPHSINKVCRKVYTQTKGYVFRRNNEPFGQTAILVTHGEYKHRNFNT